MGDQDVCVNLNAFNRGGCKGAAHDRVYSNLFGHCVVELFILVQLGHVFGYYTTKIAFRCEVLIAYRAIAR